MPGMNQRRPVAERAWLHIEVSADNSDPHVRGIILDRVELTE